MKATAKYEKANYDNIRLRVPKGKKQIIKSYAEEKGESINSFINKAIDERLEKDNPQAYSITYMKK